MATTKFDYSSNRNIAISLIYRFGALYTHQTVDTSYTESFDPDTGGSIWTSGTTTVYIQPMTSETAQGVVIDFTEDERRDSSIKVGDKKLLTVEITTPVAGDVFVIGSTSYSYINHETIQPASTSDPILYKVQLRV